MNKQMESGPLRICLVTETFPSEVNGVARTLRALVLGLVERGHSVEVVRPKQAADRSETAAKRYSEILVPGAPLPGYTRLRFGFFCRGRLLQRWQSWQPHVVHVATEGPLGLSAVLAARRLGIPLCSTFHTNFHIYGRFYGFGLLTRQAMRYLRFVHNRTRRTLVPSHDSAETLRGEGFRRVEILGRGVDIELFHPARRCHRLRREWGLFDDGTAVLYVGRLAPEKNIQLAIDAFDLNGVERPDRPRFVLVGDGPHEISLRRSHPEFVFPGLRKGEALASHYASGDVLLFPSLTETFGNVVLEAMASGLAVVAFDYAAGGQLIEDGRNGVKVPFGDRQAFVRAARQLIAGGVSVQRSLGRRARETAEVLGWPMITGQFERHLREVMTEATV